MSRQDKEFRIFSGDELLCVTNDDGRLGCGTFGEVRLAFHAVHNAVALKWMKTLGGVNKARTLDKKIQNELSNLHKANHENVVRVLGWTRWANAVAIVMEYLPGGNLMELIENDDVELKPFLQLRICAEVANGLSFVHNFSKKKRLVHGDIKTENVLLTNDLHCKISDFGSAKISSCTGTRTVSKIETEPKAQFSNIYAAPEFIKHPLMKRKPSYDTFSYSILVYVLLNEELPENSQSPIFENAICRGQRPDLENIFDRKRDAEDSGQDDEIKAMDTLIDVMTDCWQQEPSERPTMLEVKEKLYGVLNRIPSEKILQTAVSSVEEMKMQTPSKEQCSCILLNQFQPFTSGEQVSGYSTLHASNSVSARQSSSVSFHVFEQPTSIAHAAKETENLVKANFPFEPRNQDELKLDMGDIVQVLEHVEDGWALGQLNDQKGLFPTNFCVSFTNSPAPNPVVGDSSETMELHNETTPKEVQPSTSSPHPDQSNHEKEQSSDDSSFHASLPIRASSNASTPVSEPATSEIASDCTEQSSDNPSLHSSMSIRARSSVSTPFSQPTIPSDLAPENTGVLQTVKSLWMSLVKNEVTQAINESQLLASMITVTLQAEVIVDYIIEICDMFNKKSKYLTSLKLIDWGSDVCENIEDPEIKSKKFIGLSVAADVSCEMSNANMKDEIDKSTLILLCKLKEKLKQTQIKDNVYKTEYETWCSLYIGRCYYYIDEYEQSLEIAKSCLSSVTSLFGVNAKKHKLQACCFGLLAAIHYGMGNYSNAVDLREREIVAVTSAEDKGEDEKEQWIKKIVKYLLEAGAKAKPSN